MLYPQIRGKILKHVKLLSQHNPAHFHQSQWGIQSQYRHSMFISANFFCSLRIFFPDYCLSRKEQKKEKRKKKKKKFSKFSFSLPKSYLQVIRCIACHDVSRCLTLWVHIMQLISVETIFHYFGFSYPFYQVQSSYFLST